MTFWSILTHGGACGASPKNVPKVEKKQIVHQV
jgi:hypothetical protein